MLAVAIDALKHALDDLSHQLDTSGPTHERHRAQNAPFLTHDVSGLSEKYVNTPSLLALLCLLWLPLCLGRPETQIKCALSHTVGT